MKRADESVSAKRRSRASALPPFKAVDSYRDESRGTASILVKVADHLAGLQRLIRRNPAWQTPLNVASILLWRFDQRITDVEVRANIAVRAMQTGDLDRVLLELSAIRSVSRSGRVDGLHCISVTHDLARQGIAQYRGSN